ncbi:MAG: transcription factor S [Methanomicrobiales archaeon]|nr:transcription factor S [Methanomicrobiales archaeon]
MFCPKCRSLMISSGGQMKCRRCGFIREFSENDSLQLTKSRGQREITIIDDTEKVPTLPTITIRCPKCGNNTAFWWLRQLRAADESEVRFFRCCKCEHTWRQYD